MIINGACIGHRENSAALLVSCSEELTILEMTEMTMSNKSWNNNSFCVLKFMANLFSIFLKACFSYPFLIKEVIIHANFRKKEKEPLNER